MSEIIKLDHISQYNELMGVETLHPLISFIDCYKIGPTRFGRKLFGFYAVIIKDMQCGDMKYGRSRYDYEQGSVVCVAPGQLMGSEDDGQLHQPEGYILMFHPDLLHGTSLARNMKNYTFFSYEVNEALHLSSQERKVVLEVKKETGTTVLKYIHLKLLDIAKSKIVDSGKSLSEIAYELGFKYPQHFSRFFKKTAGCSPNEYRQTSQQGIHI